jgi:hypothetical protein
MSTCSVTQNLHHPVVLTKRRKRVAIILLAVIGGVIAYAMLHQEDEPEYLGRRLSEWLDPDQNGMNGADSNRDEAIARTAVRNIGTNALPYLLKWIDYEPPAWRKSLRRTLNRTMWQGLSEGGAARRAYITEWGFAFLGTNAASAIPALEAMMKDSKKPERSSRAIYVLGCIGEPAIPLLKAALADSNQPDRPEIVSAFRLIVLNQGTNVCLPILIEALKHPDPSVRKRAEIVLFDLAPKFYLEMPMQ